MQIAPGRLCGKVEYCAAGGVGIDLSRCCQPCTYTSDFHASVDGQDRYGRIKGLRWSTGQVRVPWMVRIPRMLRRWLPG